MRTIIAGCRDYTPSIDTIASVVFLSEFVITQVISGGASGVDSAGEAYARHNKLDLRVFMADWNAHGKAAGPIRNEEMAKNADALIAFWDGSSRGTKNMIDTATRLGLKVYVHKIIRSVDHG